VSADPHDFFASAPVRTLDTPPPELTAPTLARPRPRNRGVFGLVLALLLTAIVAVAVHGHLDGSHRGGATGLVADGEGGTTRALGGSPPVTVTSHPSRLMPAVLAPAGAGGYVFDAPARFDPCQPIRYVVSGAEPFAGANALLTQVLSEVSARSGLKFVNAGPTTERAQPDRPSYQPDRYGQTWAPVLVAWTDQAAEPRLAGNIIGLGGPAVASVRGKEHLVSGLLYFDAPELSLIAQWPTGFAQMRTVMLHEIGHLVGLGHVVDPTAVMYPSDGGQGDYNLGDLRGLAYAGSGPCSKYH